MMNVFIVDTNIVFSAAIRPQSGIGQFVMLSSMNGVKLYAPEFLQTEIERHFPKLVQRSGLTEALAREQVNLFYQCIQFIPDRQIPIAYLSGAMKFVRGVDEDDVFFVALNDFFGEYLWTGDKKLYRHLIKKGYERVLDFEEVKAKQKGS